MKARNSGDLGAIGLASERVIALGLVEMARLRLDKKAYDEAIQLCRDSLGFEDTPETRVELAIVSLYAKKPSDAAEQAIKAAEMDPQNALAWNIKGEALLQSEDYAGAAAALGRSLELKQDAESTYALGIAYLGQGEKQKAAETFVRLLVLIGDHGWSRVLVGRAYQEQKLPEEAEVEFRNALRLEPRTPNAHYFWALTLLQANEWSRTAAVQSHLEEELKLNPRHFLANYLLGFFATNEKEYDESDRYLHLAATLNPSLPEVWLYLGLNAQGRKDNRSAEAHFRKAVELAKNADPKEHLSIRKAYIGLGRILLTSGRKKEGEELLQKARELQVETLAESQKKMSAMHTKEGAGVSGAVVPDLPETEKRFSLPPVADRGLSREPGSPLAPRRVANSPQDPAASAEKHLRAILGSSFNDLATAEALQEKYDLAVKHYREAAKWNSEIPGLQRNLGLAAFFVGEHAEAIRLLATAIRANPGDAHARAVLGLAYFATENFTQAAQTISPIADRAEEDPQLGFAWAKSLAEVGNKIRAAHELEILEKANPSLSAWNLIQFGQLWLDLNETERAEQAFHRALRAEPGNAEAKCALGTALMQLSKPKDAADLFLAILADQPEHPEALFQMGRASLELGNLSESIRYLEAAARLQPAILGVHLALEAAYRKAGRTSDADREHSLAESFKNVHKMKPGYGLKAHPN